jgi:hypothetical protein
VELLPDIVDINLTFCFHGCLLLTLYVFRRFLFCPIINISPGVSGFGGRTKGTPAENLIDLWRCDFSKDSAEPGGNSGLCRQYRCVFGRDMVIRGLFDSTQGIL